MKSLTLEKAVQHARAFEAVSKEAGMFMGAEVHEVKKGRAAAEGSSCFRCGRVGHEAESCWHVKTLCNKCHKRGHLAVICQKKSSNERADRNGQFAKRTERRTEAHRTCGQSSSSHAVQQTQQPQEQPPSCQQTLELDTGAEITTLPLHVFEKYFRGSQLRQTARRLSQYDGSPLKIIGEMSVTVGYKGQVIEDSILVVDVKSRYPLLGRDWMFKTSF